MNFVTVFAASCLTLSVAIPGGFYVAGEMQHRFTAQQAAAPGQVSLWITTPAFTLMDAQGGRHHMVAAVGAHNREEAARLCKYLPIVRDRLQRFASSVRVVGSSAGQPKLQGSKDILAEDLGTALGFSAPPALKIVESGHSVQKVIRAKPTACDGGKLAA